MPRSLEAILPESQVPLDERDLPIFVNRETAQAGGLVNFVPAEMGRDGGQRRVYVPKVAFERMEPPMGVDLEHLVR